MEQSYGNIVPTDLQDELMTIRDGLTHAAFRIGDILLQVIQERPDAKLSEIHNAVAMFAGKRARTIREYAAIAAFYPKSTRVIYDVLSFDHFRHAMQYGKKWEEALNWCVEQIEVLNRPATVDAMIAHFETEVTGANYADDSDGEEVTNNNGLLEEVRRFRDALLFTDKVPESLVKKAVVLVNEILAALAVDSVMELSA